MGGRIPELIELSGDHKDFIGIIRASGTELIGEDHHRNAACLGFARKHTRLTAIAARLENRLTGVLRHCSPELELQRLAILERFDRRTRNSAPPSAQLNGSCPIAQTDFCADSGG